MSWHIVETTFDPAHAQAYEGLFTLGSGYLHVRGSFEEHLHEAPQAVDYMRRPANTTAEAFPAMKVKWGAFVPGVYGEHPLLNQEMLNLPFFLDLRPSVDGEKLDMERSRLSSYRRALDLKHATLTRSCTWHTHQGATLKVSFERFVSAARPHLCIQRLRLESDRDVTVTLRAGIDTDVRTSGYDHFASVMLETGADTIDCRVTSDYGDTARIVSRLSGTGWRDEQHERAAYLHNTLTLAGGQPVHIEKHTAVTTDQDQDETALDPQAALEDTAALGYEALHAEHAALWQARWAKADVLIEIETKNEDEDEDDDAAQLRLRTSIYHLLRAHPNTSRVAIGPKGYAGDAYRGCFFWDTEMYMLPFFLYTDPARARHLADFRVHTLPGAEQNARRYGYPGAKYAWESDREGREACPNWQYADHEVHITADVVYGLAHYARAADPDYLQGPARSVVLQAARYWLARIDHRPGDDHPSILGVMGPDEYAAITHNNAYTNRLAAFTLALAAQLGNDEDECQAFAAAAEGLPVPRRADGLVLQSEDFERFAEPDYANHWRDRSKPFAAQVSQERLYRTKCLKQADVLMLMMLFPGEFSDAEVRQAWDYYLPYTNHDSSLSAGAHALVALRLGMMDQALRFWEHSLNIDFDMAHGGPAEGIHIASAGVNWQIAVFGFGGLSSAMQADTLTLRPKLPPGWARLAFPLVWHGTPVYIDIRPDEIKISNRGSADIAVCLGDDGSRRVIAPSTDYTNKL